MFNLFILAALAIGAIYVLWILLRRGMKVFFWIGIIILAFAFPAIGVMAIILCIAGYLFSKVYNHKNDPGFEYHEFEDISKDIKSDYDRALEKFNKRRGK